MVVGLAQNQTPLHYPVMLSSYPTFQNPVLGASDHLQFEPDRDHASPSPSESLNRSDDSHSGLCIDAWKKKNKTKKPSLIYRSILSLLLRAHKAFFRVICEFCALTLILWLTLHPQEIWAAQEKLIFYLNHDKNWEAITLFFLKYSNNQMFLNIVNRKFGPINFLSTGTRRNTNMFNGPANLTKFDRRKSDKSYSKDPYLLCRKALRNGIELCQDRFLSMRRLSTLLPFGSLSLGVFFSVDLSFTRRRPMNITGAVAWKPRFHHMKIVSC